MTKQDGYITDTTYPIFFYKEMQPLWLNTVISFLGFKTPNLQDTFHYLELACATGINLCVAALNYPHAHFVGIDFNLAHIEQAQHYADTLGIRNIQFIHCDFAEFLQTNQQNFDYIVNHGTYSWVAPAQQQQILQISQRYLNPLGIFYLHYMCYPGSSALQPIQKLLHLVDQHQPSLVRIETAKQLFEQLHSYGAFIDYPQIEGVIQSLKHPAAYLAHEFLSDHWQPLYSVDVHQNVFQMTQMPYLGSAYPYENLDSISLPEKLQPLVRDTQDPALKEYLKDIARNAKQRCDVFQKAPQALANMEHINILRNIKFKMFKHTPRQSSIDFKTPIGKIHAPKAVIAPLVECLFQQPQSFATLLNFSHFKTNPIFLIETLFLMLNAQYVHPICEQKSNISNHQIEVFHQLMQSKGLNLHLDDDCASAF